MALNNSAETESSLIRLAQTGDRNAFGELVRRHYGPVVNVVYRLCGDIRLAEDMAQETFLKAWMKLPTYRPEYRLRNWLYRIALNASVDVLRRRREETVDEQILDELPEQAASPETILMEKEQTAMVQQALKSLPEASRSVLVLREYGDLTYQEIAQVLTIPIGTVMSRLNSARTLMRETLKGLLLKTENEYV